MDKDQIKIIVENLTYSDKDFLRRVANNESLPLATRAQDAVRKKLKILGLVHVVKNPRRWEILPLGKEVLTKI